MSQAYGVQDFDLGDESTRTHSVFDLDRLRLKKGQTTRMIMLDPTVKGGYYHYITINDPTSKRRGKYAACLGNPAVLKSAGDSGDPQSCPACQSAPTTEHVSVARRRFVSRMGVYRTSERGDLIRPTSIAMSVLVYGDDKYNAFSKRRENHGPLNRKDLIVTCTVEEYQKWDIDVADPLLTNPNLGDQERAQLVASWQAMVAEPTPDLDKLLGERVSAEELRKMCVGSLAPFNPVGPTELLPVDSGALVNTVTARAAASGFPAPAPGAAAPLTIDQLYPRPNPAPAAVAPAPVAPAPPLAPSPSAQAAAFPEMVATAPSGAVPPAPAPAPAFDFTAILPDMAPPRPVNQGDDLPFPA